MLHIFSSSQSLSRGISIGPRARIRTRTIVVDILSKLLLVSGLYAMSMNCLSEAETQLNAALRTSRETELWTFANLNLAIVYLRFVQRQSSGPLPTSTLPSST